MTKTGAYSLIEAIVVVAIIAILTAAAVVYSGNARESLIVSRERANIISAIYRAKALTVSTYNNPSIPCGYGVHIDRGLGTYVLFKDRPASCAASSCTEADCIASDNKYLAGSSDEVIESYTLPSDYQFAQIPNNFDILYRPPDPTAILTPPGGGSQTVKIQGPNGTGFSFKVNNAGQITIL